MKKRITIGGAREIAVLFFGTAAFSLIGWQTNVALAALVSAPLLMRFLRQGRLIPRLLLLWPLLALASAIGMWGGWDLEPLAMVAALLFRPLPLLLALALDRLCLNRLGRLAATLVFPTVMVALDWLVSLTPLSTVLSLAVGTFGLRELAQVASLAGVWGLGFVVWWLAPAINRAWDEGWNLKAAGAALALPLAVFAGALAYGALRIGASDAGAPTVRVAGVSAEHPRDYWNLIDLGTPRAEAVALRPETARIEDRLFDASARAAASGAKFIVWSEGACVLDEETEAAFAGRARVFARANACYLAAAVLTFHFGSSISDNKILMFTPSGDLAFTYVKTISWYPTGSDGILKTVDTPYGRVGAAICFDMDRPSFARRLGALGADLVLVPAYDSPRIRPFHTEVGLFRAIENGYSMFRQVAAGTSMAVDGRGGLRAWQDYYADPDRLMIADLPRHRARPLALLLGDLPAWLCSAGAVLLVGLAFARKPRQRGAQPR
jgi:apolipoprotein N-acyltransferase